MPGELRQPRSPAQLRAWGQYLASHPDQRFARFIMNGLTRGFRVGVSPSCRIRSTKGNLPSARDHTQTISVYIQAELTEARLIGPLPSPIVGVHISPIGLIPKPHQPGKWRMIMDLSSPTGASVNDAIDKALCSLNYTSVDEAVAIVRTLGQGALMAKLDLKSAYRMVPVAPVDQPLLGFTWEGQTFLDAALPFGLRSAPKLFTAVADALAWAMAVEGVSHFLHYLDDFFIAGPAENPQCALHLQTAVVVCNRLHFPVAHSKTEGPSTSITYLGILIDSSHQHLALPRDKLHRLQRLISAWSQRKRCRKRELQSLLGHLHHAATVIPPGRIFTRSLIDADKRTKKPHFHININRMMKADLAWWAEFLPSWNGTHSFLPVQPTATITSDASGSWGCGAFTATHWFQVQWPPAWQQKNIAWKEMVPVLLAAAIWGQTWRGTRVCFRSDNMAALPEMLILTAVITRNSVCCT